MDVVEVLTDAELELVLAGREVPGRTDLDGLAGAVAELRERTAAEPVPALGVDLRIALAEAEVRARGRSDAPVHAAPAVRSVRRAQRQGLVAAAVAAVALGVGVTQSALPDGLQEIASKAAKQLGITLPAPVPEPVTGASAGQPGAERVEVRRSGGRSAEHRPAARSGPDAPGAAALDAPGRDGDAPGADAPGRERVPPDRDTGVPDGSASPAPRSDESTPPGPDPLPAPTSQPQTDPEGPAPAPTDPTEAGDTGVSDVEETPDPEPHPSDRRPEHAPGPQATDPDATTGTEESGPQATAPPSPDPSAPSSPRSGPQQSSRTRG
jgi:hypothetical protein